MTEGITKERLGEIRSYYASELNISDACLIDDLLNDECTELNPWQPIESAPKDRPIKIYDAGYGQVVVNWSEFYTCFIDPHGHKYLNPTHWCELPEDPK